MNVSYIIVFDIHINLHKNNNKLLLLILILNAMFYVSYYFVELCMHLFFSKSFQIFSFEFFNLSSFEIELNNENVSFRIK